VRESSRKSLLPLATLQDFAMDVKAVAANPRSDLPDGVLLGCMQGAGKRLDLSSPLPGPEPIIIPGTNESRKDYQSYPLPLTVAMNVTAAP